MRLIVVCSVVVVVVLIAFSQASGAPGETGEDREILCQDRPPREDEGPRRRDDRREDRKRDDRANPDDARRMMKDIEKMRKEIERLHEAVGEAEERGEHDKAAELRKKAGQMERKLQELERQMPPRFGPPGAEGPPRIPPEEAEEMKRNIQRLVEEAAEAKEQGDMEKAERLMEEARRLEETLRRGHKPPLPEREFSEEDIQKVTKWLKENEPEMIEKLESLRGREPGAYYHFLRDVFMKMERMEELKKRDPEGYKRLTETRKLDRKVWQLMEKYKHADEDEARDKLKAELKQVLSRLFDLKQAQHKAEIAELEKEVAKLKEIYKHHEEQKQEIIEERLRELTGKKKPFDW